MKPTLGALALLTPLALAACGGAPPPAPKAAGAKDGKPATRSAPATAAKADPEQALLRTMQKEDPIREGKGVLSFREARKRGDFATRAQIEPVAFRANQLPVVEILEPLQVARAPRTLPGSDGGSDELLVDFRGSDAAKIATTYGTVRVTLAEKALGRLRIGSNEAALSPENESGVFVTCGGPPGRGGTLQPARWEKLAKGPNGTIHYTVVDGWFDTATCKASVVNRAFVDAGPLPGGVLFGFRETCTSRPREEALPQQPPPSPQTMCAPGESLTILGPRLSHVVANGVGGDARTAVGQYTRVSLPLRRGGGGSVVERTQASSISEWARFTGATASFRQDVLLGVEVAQAVEDAEPVSVAYVAEGG